MMLKLLTQGARLAACALVMIGLPLGAYAGTKAVIGQKAADGGVTLYSQRFQETLEDGTPVANIAITTVDGYLQLTRKGYPGGACRVETTPIVDQIGEPVPAGADSSGQTLYIVNGQPVVLTRCLDAGCKAKSGFPSPGPEPFKVAWCDVTPISKQQCACHEVKLGAIHATPGTDCKRSVVTLENVLPAWVLAAYIISDY